MEEQNTVPCKFRKHERVLCYHGPLVCEAVCVDSKFEAERKENVYWIVYRGPGRHWEKWVPERRLIRRNLTNVGKHKRLIVTKPMVIPVNRSPPHESDQLSEYPVEEYDDDEEEDDDSDGLLVPGGPVEDDADPAHPPSPPPEEDKDEGDDRFLSADSDSDSEDDDQVSNAVNIELPPSLIVCLAEDWRLINKEKMLAKLPPPKTVHQILLEFLQITESKEQGEPEDKIISRRHMAVGVRKYFDMMVGPQLMYRSEQAQYNSVKSQHGEDAEMSKVYGAVHFLRLFVRLGWAIGFSEFDENTQEHFMSLLYELLSFIDDKSEEYFTGENYFSP